MGCELELMSGEEVDKISVLVTVTLDNVFVKLSLLVNKSEINEVYGELMEV